MVCFPGGEEQLHQKAEFPTKSLTILTAFSTKLEKMLDLEIVFPFNQEERQETPEQSSSRYHATESPCHEPKMQNSLFKAMQTEALEVELVIWPPLASSPR